MSIQVTDDLWIAAGTTVTWDGLKNGKGGADQFAFVYADQTSPGAVFRNSGSIDVVGYGARNAGLEILTGDEMADARGYLFWNDAQGVLSVTDGNSAQGSWRFTAGVFSPELWIPVRNDGLITVSGDEQVYGVWEGGFPGSVVNTGHINVTSSLSATGVDIDNGGVVDNSGDIEVFGQLTAEGVFFDNVPQFTNSGTIHASVDASSPYASVALDVFELNPTQTFENSGLLWGDYAIRVIDGDGLSTISAASERVDNTGEIRGVVSLAYGDDLMLNAGVVNGPVDLGQGADVYDGVEGVQAGGVFGGAGSDALVGGAGADVLIGGFDADAISGGGGDDTVDGGRGRDALDGGAGIDTLSYLQSTSKVIADLGAGKVRADGLDRVLHFERLVGSVFADKIDGGGAAETLEGAGGNDSINGGGGDDVLIGDHGADTLAGGAGNDSFVFSAGDGRDLVTDFQPGGRHDRLLIYGYDHAQSIVQNGSDVVISLAAHDSIRLSGVSLSALSGSEILFSSDPLPAQPEPDLIRTVDVLSPLVIGRSEIFDVHPDIAIIGGDEFDQVGFVMQDWYTFEANPGISNSGAVTVESTLDGGTLTGIQEYLGATYEDAFFINQKNATFQVLAHDYVAATGLVAGYGVWNYGLLKVVSDASDALGLQDGAHPAVNAGRIEVSAATAAKGAVIAGMFWNTGSISVAGGVASTGVRLTQSYAANGFVNSGSIVVQDATASQDSVGLSFGNEAYGTVTFHNSGLIQAEFAIRYAFATTGDSTGTNLFYNSGDLRGRVEMSVGIDHLYNSGTITGLIDLGDNNDVFDGRTGVQQSTIVGGKGNDLVLGGAAGETLQGGAGDDTVCGGGGGDTISGGTGNDRFHFDAGWGAATILDFTAGGQDDVLDVGYSDYRNLQQVGADTQVVFDSGDTILLKNVQATALTAADFHFGAAAIPVSPAEPATPKTPKPPALPRSDAAPGYAQVGGDASETLNGGAKRDVILGAGGADLIQGGAGNDYLSGGDGDDTLVGGTGHDLMAGGAGADVFVVPGRGYEDVLVDFNAAEGDTLQIASDASYRLVERAGEVVLHLQAGGSLHIGGTTRAEVEGAIRGGVEEAVPLATGPSTGAQHVRVLTMSQGVHRLVGGAGADTFVLAPGPESHVKISRLSDNDHIRVAGSDHSPLVAPGSTGQSDQVRLDYHAHGDRTVLGVDFDGDGHVDLTVAIKGDHHDFTGFVA